MQWVSRKQIQGLYFRLVPKNYDTQNSTELYKEIILHFRFQVAALSSTELSKQNCLVTKVYPDVS